MKKNTKLRSSVLAGALSLSLSLSALSPAVIYQSSSEQTETVSTARTVSAVSTASLVTKINYNLPGITSRNVLSLTQKTLTVNGQRMSDNAVVMNDIVYVPIDTVAKAVGNATVTHNTTTKTTTLSMSGLYLTATDSGFVTYANDRPLFSFSPNTVMSNGRMYIPAVTLCKALGLSITQNTAQSLSISGTYKALTPASSFYRQDEVYWLSKIISAESGGETLLGQIAVGDVILNRVRSTLYPNTIYGVIFDKKYGVQFSPTLDGSIYNDPTYTSILAAKICLEGTSLSDNALFFLNPRVAQSSWIIKSRKYAYTIGSHDFYI